MQARPIRLSGGSIWGPIDVFPEITEKKTFNKIEFQLNEWISQDLILQVEK